MEVWHHEFLTSAVYGDGRLTSCPNCYTSGERASSTQWIGGWVSPRARVDIVGAKKSASNGKRNAISQTSSPRLNRCTHYVIPKAVLT
jgi:hypothetical protein